MYGESTEDQADTSVEKVILTKTDVNKKGRKRLPEGELTKRIPSNKGEQTTKTDLIDKKGFVPIIDLLDSKDFGSTSLSNKNQILAQKYKSLSNKNQILAQKSKSISNKKPDSSSKICNT